MAEELLDELSGQGEAGGGAEQVGKADRGVRGDDQSQASLRARPAQQEPAPKSELLVAIDEEDGPGRGWGCASKVRRQAPLAVVQFNQEGGPLPNGFSLFEGIKDPSIEPLGCIGTALNEALVQSVSAEPGEEEIISVFPAWPRGWDGIFRLLVRGGFMVCSSIKSGTVEFVEIESRRGEPCRLRNPWGRPCEVRQAEGPSEQIAGEILVFATEAGGRYLVLPEGEPVPTPRRITAEPATEAASYRLTLPGGTVEGTLGIRSQD